MKSVILASLAIASLLTSSASAKMVTRIDKGDAACKEVPKSKDAEGDYLLTVCPTPFGVKRWTIIHEAVRYGEGFGTVENTTNFIAAGIADGPYEWWGEEKAGTFKPKFVIKRYITSDYGTPEKRSTQLVVFKLLPDGRSCEIGYAKTNSRAREFVRADSPCGGQD